MIAPPDCEAIAGSPPESVEVDGVVLRAGSRVRLRPAAGGDALDGGLAGRTACIEGLDQDDEGRVHIAVTLDDDPGRDLGEARFPGHRFYFGPHELEPLAPAPLPRILVAGIGNVFLGDDGFGVEVARQLLARRLAPGVQVVDFGIRGMDLVYALQSGYDAVVLVDACARGAEPGTLFAIEPECGARGADAPQAHGMDPDHALELARSLGARLGPVRIVGCEPGWIPAQGAPPDERWMELSPPVRAAIPAALELVLSLVSELAEAHAPQPEASRVASAADAARSSEGGDVDGTTRTDEGADPGAGADRAGRRRDLDAAPRDPA